MCFTHCGRLFACLLLLLLSFFIRAMHRSHPYPPTNRAQTQSNNPRHNPSSSCRSTQQMRHNTLSNKQNSSNSNNKNSKHLYGASQARPRGQASMQSKMKRIDSLHCNCCNHKVCLSVCVFVYLFVCLWGGAYVWVCMCVCVWRCLCCVHE